MQVKFLNRTVMVAVLALSGCDTMNAALFPATTAPAPTLPAVEAPAQAATVPVDPALRPSVKPRPASPRINPATLVGKNQTDVRNMLGSPTIEQSAPPATIWRYVARDCTLDIFFYLDFGTNSLKALTYDAKTADVLANDETVSRCVGLVQTTNRTPSR